MQSGLSKDLVSLAIGGVYLLHFQGTDFSLLHCFVVLEFFMCFHPLPSCRCQSVQQEIAAATDAAVRKYNEDVPPEEVTREGVAAAMRASIKDSTEKLYKKLFKIVSVANPAHGVEWLQEVQFIPLLFMF